MARATLVLYSTLGCHLCEQAELLLLALPLTEPLVVEVVDISDDDMRRRAARTIGKLDRIVGHGLT